MIRFAEERDINDLIHLLQQVGEVHHIIRPDLFKDGAQKYDEVSLKELLKDSNRPIIVYETNNRVIGYMFAIIEITKDHPVLSDRKVLYIDDLCVDEDYRGKDIAKALYEYTLEYAKSIECDAVTLNVWSGNDRAMAFYEKMGLTPYKIGMEQVLKK